MCVGYMQEVVKNLGVVLTNGSLYGLPVCDLYHNSGFNKLTLNSLTIDCLHPNLLGMIEEGSYLSGFISKV